jgi:hypothetical protein
MAEKTNTDKAQQNVTSHPRPDDANLPDVSRFDDGSAT